MPQDTVLFNDSLLHNLRYGRADASVEEVLEAATCARLDATLALMPDGLDTMVGERGVKLSGGEKQRVAIARAFLRQPRLLLADEATSALDTATEIGILQSLQEVASGRTAVFVAHRLSTVRSCDVVVVMENGKIVESGASHLTLVPIRPRSRCELHSLRTFSLARAFRFSPPTPRSVSTLARPTRRLSTNAPPRCVSPLPKQATTARPRENVPLVTARNAAKLLAAEAKRGKVAVLFGNERTGLTNEELGTAHAAVAIPTAGQGSLCRKSLKYTGGTGPTSLNLSQAVGVIAYEMFLAADEVVNMAEDGTSTVAGTDAGTRTTTPRTVGEGKIDVPRDRLMTVGEKTALKRELLRARRALDVLTCEAGSDGDGDGAGDEMAGDDVAAGDGVAGDDVEDADEALDAREDRGLERVLNAAPLMSRDAAALFQLARRVKALRVGVGAGGDGDGEGEGVGLLDETVVRVARAARARAAEQGKPPPSTRAVRKIFRERFGLSLTNREIERALRVAAREESSASR